jgi:hypothetical protein
MVQTIMFAYFSISFCVTYISLIFITSSKHNVAIKLLGIFLFWPILFAALIVRGFIEVIDMFDGIINYPINKT